VRPEMEFGLRWQRIRHAINLLGGIAVGLAVAFFIVGNVNPINVHWRIPTASGSLLDWSFSGISLWFVAIVPLLVGLAAGYLYQTPARMHHFREHMRHRHRVHELEHELKELRTSLDRLLMMPEDGRPAIPAQIMAPIERRTAESADEPEEVEVLAAKPVGDEVKGAALESAAAPKADKPRRRWFGGLKAEVAEIKLPASIPATVVARPRRDAKAANGKPQSAPRPAAKAAARPAAKSAAKPAAKPTARAARRVVKKPA
jgi:hypothetical protein